MKVKKYTGKDMNEAMVKVRGELGSDAVILNSKKVESGGFLGMFTKKNIEVIAAVDPAADQPASAPKPAARTRQPASESDAWKKEIAELKKMIADRQPQTEIQTAAAAPFPEQLESLNSMLQEEDTAPHIRLQLMNSLLRRWYQQEEQATDTELQQWLEEEIRSRLPEANGPAGRKYLNVFGPTGVGKTTTLAKIAAQASVKEGKSVGFISTDTFRIAAIEQLKTYADILQIPLEVAYSMEDFQEAKQRLNHCDLILIDSAGRNFRNPLYINQLRELIDFDQEMENHLVLAATSKYKDMKHIISQFELIRIDRLIFTKLDETNSAGGALNAVLDHGIPVSYYTTGQNVPDDIRPGDRETMIRALLQKEAWT
ncbi:flagellar biosynthesis protein FlhF [Alkalicoccus chagannorensis]|uniref:flagellar biosynthesis protein FlhF n=1 Tax=Alkalicoccus chagannorensis TaxID=427072 RepID=UPI00040E14C5|nr:flagellar biosynthesis protein FlhF [Alkalicoccus chagannorensis]